MQTLMQRTDKEDNITKCRKAPNQKVYQSFNLAENDETRNTDIYKRGIR